MDACDFFDEVDLARHIESMADRLDSPAGGVRVGAEAESAKDRRHLDVIDADAEVLRNVCPFQSHRGQRLGLRIAVDATPQDGPGTDLSQQRGDAVRCPDGSLPVGTSFEAMRGFGE